MTFMNNLQKIDIFKDYAIAILGGNVNINKFMELKTDTKLGNLNSKVVIYGYPESQQKLEAYLQNYHQRT